MRLRTRGAEVIGLPWLSMTSATALVIAALLLFRVELFRGFQSYLTRRDTETTGIGLRVARAGDDLRITWRAPAVVSARSGALAIDDGGKHQVVRLSREELGAGQVVYQPVSPVVALRMDIEDDAGRRTTETASVLGLAAGVAAVVTQPAPAQAEPRREPFHPALLPPPQPARNAAPEQARLTAPAAPKSALRSIAGAIRVDVHVTADASGAVRSAELVSPGPSAYFAKLAVAAARASVLPRGAGSAVLHYEFTPAGFASLAVRPAGAAIAEPVRRPRQGSVESGFRRNSANSMKPSQTPKNPCFSSGPCAKRPGWTVDALKGAAVGRSHRAKIGKDKLAEVIDRSRKILGMPADYVLGIVPASDTGAIEMAMWSMLGERGVDVFCWESFGSGWAADCKNQLKLKDLRVFKADYGKMPDFSQADWTRDVVFPGTAPRRACACPTANGSRRTARAWHSATPLRRSSPWRCRGTNWMW